MKADSKTEAEIKAVLEKLADAYKMRNIEEILAIFPQDPDVILIGTGADEKRIGREEAKIQFERDWEQSDAAVITFGWMSISAAEAVAWVAAEVEFRVTMQAEELLFPGRMTFVLEKRGNTWYIMQIHASVASTQEEGESWIEPTA